MKAWRSCGFVQDSEEEDEDLGTSPNRSQDNDAQLAADNVVSSDNSSVQHRQWRGSSGVTDGKGSQSWKKLGRRLQSHEVGEDPNAELEGPADSVRRNELSALRDGQASYKDVMQQQELVDAGDVSALISFSSSLPDVQDLIFGQQIDDIAGASPKEPSRLLSSSPLSSINEELAADPHELHGLAVTRDAFARDAFAPQRNLRQRKAIQLHPYLILDGQYLKEMRERGIRPTRIRQASSAPNADDQDHSSQSPSQSEEETQSPIQSLVLDLSPRARSRQTRQPDSSPTRQFPSPPHALNASTHFFSDSQDDALPALEDILASRSASGLAYKGRKRRKLLHFAQAVSDDDRDVRLSDPSLRNRQDEPDIFPRVEILLSPESSSPRSQELPGRPEKGAFRFPVGFNPQKLPTPATSSSTNLARDRRNAGRTVQSSPAARVPARRTVPPDVNDQARSEIQDGSEDMQSEVSASSSENDDRTGELKAIQRRIKGVLPASWLKLDVKAQDKVPPLKPGRNHGQDVRVLVPQPGIAQRRTNSTISRSLQPILTMFSDDESEDDNIHKPWIDQPTLHPRQATIEPHFNSFSLVPDDDPGELMEDNAVDFMLPSKPRGKRQNLSRPTKRQTRLFERSGQAPAKLKARVGGKSKRLGSARTSASMRRGPPKLSVLDALPSSPERTASLPMFLKIARRQAQRLPNQARETPLNKAIRLRTREDTQEAESVLKQWHSGMLKRRQELRSQPVRRQPLAHREVNAVQSPSARNIDEALRMQKPTRVQEGAVTEQSQERLPNISHLPPTKQIRARKAPYLRMGPPNRLQDAQLEADMDGVLVMQDRLQFQRRVRQQDEVYAAAQKNALEPLPRTLSELETHMAYSSQRTTELPLVNEPVAAQTSGQPKPLRRRRLRKGKPQRIDVDSVIYRQPEIYAMPTHPHSRSISIDSDHTKALQGLNRWGMPYGRNFDILPLSRGTYFHSSTFLGSGAFKRALNCAHLTLNHQLNPHKVYIAGKEHEWGAWNEELCLQVRNIFGQIRDDLCLDRPSGHGHSLADMALRRLESSVHHVEGVLAANSSKLSFSDPVDRSAYESIYLDELEALQMLVEEQPTSVDDPIAQLLLRLVVRLLVLTTQTLMIAKDVAVSPEQGDRGQKLLRRQAEFIISYLHNRGFEELRAFYDLSRQYAAQKSGITNEHGAVEAVVVLIHTLNSASSPALSFWEILNWKMLPSIDTTHHAGALESKWLSIFTLLPLFEIDMDGIHRSGQRFHITYDNWEMVKRLLARAFALYPATASLPGNTINDYIRSLFLRCHDLIQAWAWSRCEAVISVIFDFFAKREYMSLLREDKIGSARFLEQLVNNPSLEATRDEKAFQIFLKLVANGLLAMRKVYPETKVRGIVWRWVPNHDRRLDKDKELQGEDLDALQNQHDLLATLYWASPAGYRPRIDLLQNLVDHSASHLEACRINIKTWSNLTTFQLFTDEPVESIGPFAMWLKEMLQQNIAMYRHARSELETQHEAMRRNSVTTISTDKVELMISRNQSGIVAALSEAVSGMKAAMTSARNLAAAWALLKDSDIQTVFSLLDAKSKKTNLVLIEAMSMFNAFLELLGRLSTEKESQALNEESQDYGEWPEDDAEEQELGDAGATENLAENALGFLLSHTGALLSNTFGSETAPDDELLTQLVQLWSRIASLLTRKNMATYELFLDDYGRHSWFQLRDTSQRRKFAPLFLSCLLKHDRSIIHHHREQYLSIWLCSLVEREAHLKYQHVITTDLLNTLPNDPLLRNLPFAPRTGSKTYDISRAELRESRLALLSSLLSNMRDQYQVVMQNDPSCGRSLRVEYSSLLNHLMSQMRKNYEELRQGDTIAGSYVSFVQSMIEFMQQYTSDICPVDKYFTDSAAFPLPANDPAYLVGRLKSYDSKLDDMGAAKQLIIFLQNVSERAAVDDEQGYLTRQLATVLKDMFDTPRARTTLASVLLCVIFPVYIEASLDESSAWIMSRPLLDVCRIVFADAIYAVSATDPYSIRAVMMMLTMVISAMLQSVSELELEPQRFQQPHVLLTLGLMFEVALVSVPFMSYVRRRSGKGIVAATAIDYLRDFSLFAAKNVLGYPDAFPPMHPGNGPTTDVRTAEMKAFCAQKLREDLRDKWRKVSARFEVRRGLTWREVPIKLGSLAEEKAKFIARIEAFHEALDSAKIA